jgi:hypothetical protein
MLTGDKDTDFREMMRLVAHELGLLEIAKRTGDLIVAALREYAADKYLRLAHEIAAR